MNKLLLSLLLLGGTLLSGCQATSHKATGAIFVKDAFECSGTEIGSDTRDGYFLTARHCAADLDTNEVRKHLLVSFSDDEQGPFYAATPVAISLTDDLAVLRLVNGAHLPTVSIEDERNLRGGDAIYNVSFPEGDGKLTFHGEYMGARFPCLACDPTGVLGFYPFWANAMPVNCTWAPGSSGSGVFASNGKLIGVAVGSTQIGSYNLAIPSDRVIYLLNHFSENSVDAFEKNFPVKEAPLVIGWF